MRWLADALLHGVIPRADNAFLPAGHLTDMYAFGDGGLFRSMGTVPLYMRQIQSARRVELVTLANNYRLSFDELFPPPASGTLVIALCQGQTRERRLWHIITEIAATTADTLTVQMGDMPIGVFSDYLTPDGHLRVELPQAATPEIAAPAMPKVEVKLRRRLNLRK